jgi:hypothetical protein
MLNIDKVIEKAKYQSERTRGMIAIDIGVKRKENFMNFAKKNRLSATKVIIELIDQLLEAEGKR